MSRENNKKIITYTYKINAIHLGNELPRILAKGFLNKFDYSNFSFLYDMSYHFKKGIKIFDYTKEDSFQLILDEELNISTPTKSNFSFCLGKLYDNQLYTEHNGSMDAILAINYYLLKRKNANAIITYNKQV